MTSCHPVLCFGLAIGLGSTSSVIAVPQTFNTALPVAEGEFVFREQFVYRKASSAPSPGDRELRVKGGVSVLGWGVSGNLALFGVLPYLDKNLQATMPGGRRIRRASSGISDVRLFGRYTIFKDNAPGRTFRVAPVLGIELPTGNTKDHDKLGRLPPPLQLGSGAWNLFSGMVVTYQTLDYQIDAQVSYKLNTEADHFQFGDEARFDLSLQYRIWPKDLDAGMPGFLYVVLEGNLAYTDNNKQNDIEDPNSGGTSFFLSPGIQYVTKRWIIEGIVQLPVAQNPRGTALEEDVTIRAGIRFNF